MQENKKKIIVNALAKTIKRLRGKKSQYMHCAEFGIPYSVFNRIEHAEKDPQYTTLYKLAASFGLSFSEFAKELEKDLPNNFMYFDD